MLIVRCQQSEGSNRGCKFFEWVEKEVNGEWKIEINTQRRCSKCDEKDTETNVLKKKMKIHRDDYYIKERMKNMLKILVFAIIFLVMIIVMFNCVLIHKW